MNRISLIIILLVASSSSPMVVAQNAKYVDPFIGTTNNVNDYPGAVVPWGMVSVSPENHLHRNAGFIYEKDHIYGFSHVHLSGVGFLDLGNILVIPTIGNVQFGELNYKTRYANQVAVPGYYKTDLTRCNIKAEMTATIRVGLSKYTFPASHGQANIILDMNHHLKYRDDNSAYDNHIKILNDREIEGWSETGTSRTKNPRPKVYFVARFNKAAVSKGTWNSPLKRPDLDPFPVKPLTAADSSFTGDHLSDSLEQSGSDVGAFLRFTTTDQEVILVKVGISYVSITNARLNMDTEMPDWDFDKVKAEAYEAWNKELSRITVSGGSEDQKKTFYTALYHTLIHPGVFNDVNGDYIAMGTRSVKKAVGHTQYTVYSLWDTYRTVHPLLTLVYPERQLDMVKTMIQQYRDSGWLPKWELMGNETYTMVGDPAPIVLADTYLKGINQFDVNAAYEAALKSATITEKNKLRPDLNKYLQYHYLPIDFTHNGKGEVVSEALEYCLADWNIAQLAKALGKTSDCSTFLERSKYYQNNFDRSTNFVRPKLSDGSWYSPFDPNEVSGASNWTGSGGPGFAEGSSYQYTFAVPHDIGGLMKLMGGQESFVNKLQEFFDKEHYDPTNEPDMAYPYLFTYAEHQAWRTQKLMRELMTRYYTTKPAGIPGNDDAGTLSAWYVFSAMGFYPACPGSNEYRLCSPLFDEITIHLNKSFYPGGPFVIRSENNSSNNIYIQNATLNNRQYDFAFIKHDDIVKGGKLTFRLDSNPSTWGKVKGE